VSCQLPAPNRLPVKPLPCFSNPFVSLSSLHSCPPPNLNWRKQMKIKWKTGGIVTSPSQFLLPSSSLYFSSFPPFFSPLCYIFFCLYSPLAQTIRSIHKEDLKNSFLFLSHSLTQPLAQPIPIWNWQALLLDYLSARYCADASSPRLPPILIYISPFLIPKIFLAPPFF